MIESVLASLQEQIVETRTSYGMNEIEVAPSQLVSVIQALMTQEDMPFTFLTDLCGIHLLEPTPKIGIVLHLHCLQANVRLRVKCFSESIESPTLPSLTSLFSGANWMERETYDFYGIQFVGHPNLIRILNEDELTIFPMRKEYPLEDDTREDKDDRMFGR